MRKLIERLEEGCSGTLEVDDSERGIKLAKQLAGGGIPSGSKVIGLVTSPSNRAQEAFIELKNGAYVTMIQGRMKNLCPDLLKTWSNE